MTEFEFDQMKFHWEVWKGESKAFWGRATLGTSILLLSIFFQWGVVTVSVPWITLSKLAQESQFRFFINALSWFLFLFLCFKFIDLLSHRVPERFEEHIHNNNLPIGRLGDISLKFLRRLAYVIFPAYALTMAAVLGYFTCTIFIRAVLG